MATFNPPARLLPQKLVTVMRTRYFWMIAGMMMLGALLHYYTPQVQNHPLVLLPLARHSVERIIFLLPMTGAAFAFGRTGGLLALGLSVLIMLPQAFFLSPHPVDALFDILGIAVVGSIIVWIVDAQEKEKQLRQKAVDKLAFLNSISTTLCHSKDLDEMLGKALDKVLEIVERWDPKGAIFLLDAWGQTLRMQTHRGFSPDQVARDSEVPLGECLCGLAAQSGNVLLVPDARRDPRHTRCQDLKPHSHICIPLASKERLLGVVDVYLSDPQPPVDVQLFASIGRQIGVAVENARLCENLRFFIRQITGAQEDERKRIARELHDETAQGLIDISRRLDDLSVLGDGLSEPVLARLEETQHRIEDLLQGIRRFCRDLRPSVLDDLGLLPALEGLMAEVRIEGIHPELKTQGNPRRLSPQAELALFRIVQEALNNVRRHSGATKVTIEVEFFEDHVRVDVHDNGRGFELRGRMSDLVAMGKFGLVGIQERTQLLGGYFTVLTSPERGTIVVVDVPA